MPVPSAKCQCPAPRPNGQYRCLLPGAQLEPRAHWVPRAPVFHAPQCPVACGQWASAAMAIASEYEIIGIWDIGMLDIRIFRTGM